MPSPDDVRDSIVGLLGASSLAIAGASDSNGVARNLVAWNRRLASSVRLLPLHPRNAKFLELPAFAGIADLPQTPDVLAVALGPDGARLAVEDAVARRLPAVVVYSDLRSAFADDRSLSAWVRDVQSGDTTLVGPNCMGFVSPVAQLSLYSGEVNSLAVPPGDVGIVSQSGAVVIGLLAAAPRLRFSHVFSSGSEYELDVADYVMFLAQDPATRAIGLFLEAIRDPERFRAAADVAAASGTAVVALCVGKSERARENVATHSGALAPEHAVLRSFLRKSGVIEVETLQELTETLVALRAHRRVTGGRTAMVHLSGGEASLQLDHAAGGPLTFPRLSSRTRALLSERAPWLADADNPLDAWGPPSFAENVRHCLGVLAADESIDLVIANQDVASVLADTGALVGCEVAEAVAEFAGACRTPIVVVSNTALGIDPAIQQRLESVGVPLLVGDGAGIRALERCLEFHRVSQRSPAGAAADPKPAAEITFASIPGHLLPEAETTRVLSEPQSVALLTDAGLSAPQAATAARVDDLVQSAADLTYPVVLKAVGPQLAHKSDVGAVVVGLRDADDLREASVEMAGRLGDLDDVTYLVCEQVDRHRELLLGAHRDPVFGLVMVVGMGGVLAEILRDSVLAFPPVTELEAIALIDDLRCRPWLDAWRHLGPADMTALAQAIGHFSQWLAANADYLESVDVNPIAVLEQGRGCRVLDALIVLRSPLAKEEEEQGAHV